MIPMECGGSTPLSRFEPNRVLSNRHKCPISVVVAQLAARVFFFTSHQSPVTTH
jgi:hypothetical protein